MSPLSYKLKEEEKSGMIVACLTPTTQMCTVIQSSGYLVYRNTNIWIFGKLMLKRAFQILSECLAPCDTDTRVFLCVFSLSWKQNIEIWTKIKTILDKKYILLTHYQWKNEFSFHSTTSFHRTSVALMGYIRKTVHLNQLKSNWGSNKERRKMLWRKWF